MAGMPRKCWTSQIISLQWKDYAILILSIFVLKDPPPPASLSGTHSTLIVLLEFFANEFLLFVSHFIIYLFIFNLKIKKSECEGTSRVI